MFNYIPWLLAVARDMDIYPFAIICILDLHQNDIVLPASIDLRRIRAPYLICYLSQADSIFYLFKIIFLEQVS